MRRHNKLFVNGNVLQKDVNRKLWFFFLIRSLGVLHGLVINPFPKCQILDSSKLKEFADDNSKFDINGRKYSKQVKSTVGKGEIARYEQFLLFP